MGCDIHAHFEIMLNGTWHHYSKPNLERNYLLFSKMAGVRNSEHRPIVPICQPKGLPNDMSVITRFEAVEMGPDGHSHSWFNAEEIKEIIEFHVEIAKGWCATDAMVEHDQWKYLCGGGWKSFKKYRGSYPASIQDIRLVFWFDN